MNVRKPITALGTAEWLRDGQRHEAPLSPRLLSEALYRADRFRAGNHYPQQRNYHGVYWVSATASHVWHESLLERSAAMRLDFAGDLVAIAAQPMRLRVGDWEHTPDYLTLHQDGSQTVVDVKPSSRVEKFRKQFETTASVCESVGWGYRIMTELPPQEQTTLEFLSAFRRPEDGPPHELRHATLAAVNPGSTFLDLAMHIARTGVTAGAAQRMALAMLWSRDFIFDMSRRLSHATVLRESNVRGWEALDAL